MVLSADDFVNEGGKVLLALHSNDKTTNFNYPFKIRMQFSDVIGNQYEQFIMGSNSVNMIQPKRIKH